jgi:rhodanese-related sulfurtransferase/predicted transcriptional regulator
MIKIMMSNENHQQALFNQFATVAEALAHGNRLALLELLAQGERDVETLARHLGISLASCSQHLQKLKQAGLILDRRAGRHRVYRLANDEVSVLVVALQNVAATTSLAAEKTIQERLRRLDPEPPIPAGTLWELIQKQAVHLLDVRPAEEYQSGHLPCAISWPIERLRAEPPTITPDRPIVVYCRGRYCFLALEALMKLRRGGYRVTRLEEGVPEWARGGYPVEVGAARATP